MKQKDFAKEMPFYQAYPWTGTYQATEYMKRELRNAKELYPPQLAQLLRSVEDYCGMQGEDSWIYDEYLERQRVRELVEELMEQVAMDDTQEVLVTEELIWVMVLYEILLRRMEKTYHNAWC